MDINQTKKENLIAAIAAMPSNAEVYRTLSKVLAEEQESTLQTKIGRARMVDKIDKVNKVPEIPEIPEIPEMSKMPKMPKIPKTSKIPKTQTETKTKTQTQAQAQVTLKGPKSKSESKTAGKSVKVLPSLPLEIALSEDPGFRHHLPFYERRLLGPPWKNMSCSVDTVIMALIQMNAGHTLADQVFLEDVFPHKALGFNSSLLCMRILNRDLGRTSAIERGQIRDLIRQAILPVSEQFSMTDSMDIVDVASVLIQTLPQVSYTSVTKVSYDEGKSWSYLHVVPERPRIQHFSQFQLLGKDDPDESIWSLITKFFDIQDECQPNPYLDLPGKTIRVIIDRVPYVVMATYGAIVRSNKEMAKPWSFAYTYRDGERRRAFYSMLGYALLTGPAPLEADKLKEYGGHYTLYWKDGADVIFYDGMQFDGVAQRKHNVRIDDFKRLKIPSHSTMQLAF